MDTVLLYSGGLDSFVSAGLLLEKNPERVLTCVFFDFDQSTAEVEWEAAQRCIDTLPKGKVTLLYRRLNDYKNYVSQVSIVKGGSIPTKDEDTRLFFVPGRNILFLLYSAIMAYDHGCREIAFASHKSDHTAGDCMPEFIAALQEAFSWGFSVRRQVQPYRIWSPLAHLDKAGVIREGTRLGLPLHLSWSCYDTKEHHCGICHNCDDRRRAFVQAVVPDPTEYLE